MNQNILKTQTLLILNHLLQNIEKFHINYPRLWQAEKKSKSFLNEKNIKITTRAHAFKGYASTYNVEILNLFSPETLLKDTEFAIKSKLIDLLTELKGSYSCKH